MTDWEYELTPPWGNSGWFLLDGDWSVWMFLHWTPVEKHEGRPTLDRRWQKTAREVAGTFVRKSYLYDNTESGTTLGVMWWEDSLFFQWYLVTQAEAGLRVIIIGWVSSCTQQERHPWVLPGTTEISSAVSLLQSGKVINVQLHISYNLQLNGSQHFF